MGAFSCQTGTFRDSSFLLTQDMRCSSLVPLFSPILLLFPHFSAFWQHVAVINGAVQFIPAES